MSEPVKHWVAEHNAFRVEQSLSAVAQKGMNAHNVTCCINQTEVCDGLKLNIICKSVLFKLSTMSIMFKNKMFCN